MGCCESSQEPRDSGYTQTSRIREYSQRTVRPVYSQPTVRPVQEDKPRYGKFVCHSCKRQWSSRFCWPDRYQICKGCRSRVYPHTHRELTSDDFDLESDESKEHQMDLCQRCRDLGHLCIKNKKLPGNKPRHNRNY